MGKNGKKNYKKIEKKIIKNLYEKPKTFLNSNVYIDHQFVDGILRIFDFPIKVKKPSICCVWNAWNYAVWFWAMDVITKLLKQTLNEPIVPPLFEQQPVVEYLLITCYAITAIWCSTEWFDRLNFFFFFSFKFFNFNIFMFVCLCHFN